MCGKFHTPLQMGRVRAIISCQKVINLLFLKKNRLTKTALAAKGTNFLLMFSLLPPYSLRSWGITIAFLLIHNILWVIFILCLFQNLNTMEILWMLPCLHPR